MRKGNLSDRITEHKSLLFLLNHFGCLHCITSVLAAINLNEKQKSINDDYLPLQSHILLNSYVSPDVSQVFCNFICALSISRLRSTRIFEMGVNLSIISARLYFRPLQLETWRDLNHSITFNRLCSLVFFAVTNIVFSDLLFPTKTHRAHWLLRCKMCQLQVMKGVRKLILVVLLLVALIIYALFYKNIVYKNIKAQNIRNLRII